MPKGKQHAWVKMQGRREELNLVVRLNRCCLLLFLCSKAATCDTTAQHTDRNRNTDKYDARHEKDNENQKNQFSNVVSKVAR